MDSSRSDVDFDASTGCSPASRTDLSAAAPRRPVVLLRTTLSNSSLRLAYTGGVLHHSSSIDNLRISAATTPSAMPSFADTTMRWSGPATGSDHNHQAAPAVGPAPAATATASTISTSGFAHCFETPTKITIPRRAVLSGVDDSEWSPSASLSSAAPPALSSSPPSPKPGRRSGSGSGSGSPRRTRRRHSSKGRSAVQSSIDNDSCSDEELERELMEDHYSSLEQMLARKGFEKCKVQTPDSVRQQGIGTDSPDSPSAPSSSMKTGTPFPHVRESSPLSRTLSSSTEGTAAVHTGAKHTERLQKHASVSAQQQTSAAAATSGFSSLRAKASILSITGLVSSIWGSAPTPSPLSAHASGPAAAEEEERRPVSPVPSGASGSEDDLDDDRKETIKGWLAQTAAAIPVVPAAQNVLHPRKTKDSQSSVEAHVGARSADVRQEAAPMERSSTDTTLESIPVETPTSSIVAGQAPSTSSMTKKKKSLAQLNVAFHATAVSATSMPSATAVPAGNAASTTEATGADATLERSAESLLRGTLKHAMSESSIKLAAQQQPRYPSIAAIFGAALPSPSSFASPQSTESACTVKPSKTENIATEAIKEPARPAPAARPEPKLLRKAASQNTLRMAVSPVLSTATAANAAGPSSPAQQTTPVKAVRAPPVRSNSSPTRIQTGRPDRASPRYAAHRNPRDSPVGETRVVKGNVGGTAAYGRREGVGSPLGKMARPASKGAPSIFDDAEDDEGLWTPPRSTSPTNAVSSSSSSVSTARDGKSADDATPRPSKENIAPAATQQKPRLRAKESLEHLLAIRQKQEEAERQRAQVVQHQQSTEGRKALGQLSSFHRTPLPLSQQDQNKRGSPQRSYSMPVHSVSIAGDKYPVQGDAREKGKAGFAGTLKGFFGSAMDWIAEDVDDPMPSRSYVHPQAAAQGVAQMRPHSRPGARVEAANRASIGKTATLPSVALGRGRSQHAHGSPSPGGNPSSQRDGSKSPVRQIPAGWTNDTLTLKRSEDRRRKAVSLEEYQRRLDVPTIVIHKPASE